MNRLNTLQSSSSERNYTSFGITPAGTSARAINVGSRERTTSVVAGAALVGVGLLRGRLSGLALAGVGALVIKRGLEGHCDIYEALGIDTAAGESADPHELYEHGVKIEESISIRRPAQELYDYWHDFSNLRQFMTNVERVEGREDGRSHWIISAPGGAHVEYDAETINDEPGKLIAWRSVNGADIQHAGSVRFVEQASGETVVRLNMEYIPPAGVVGGWGEKLLRLVGQSPQNDVRESLRRFKQLMEAGELATNAGGPHG